MYFRHFGLSGAPFQSTPQPSLLFMSKMHGKARATLKWSLEEEPSGCALLIGQTGSGKTTLIISLLGENPEFLKAAYVGNPKLGFDALLRDIARQLGIRTSNDRLEMFSAFDRYLDQLAPRERAVVIVDEAQGLTDETLDDLRLFSNRHQLSGRRLHFVFSGQPSLQSRLCAPQMRQMAERIGVRVMLDALEPAEGRAYVDYRLSAFGSSAGELFEHRALEHLLSCSGGIPRRINVFCHNALLHAYNAGEARVSLESARSAALEVEDFFTDRSFYHWLHAAKRLMRRESEKLRSMTQGTASALIAATVAIAGMGLLYFWNSGANLRLEPASIQTADTVGYAVIEYPAARATAGLGGEDSIPGGASIAKAVGNESEPHQVRVRVGDTLLTIAREYLGSEDDVDRLIKANPQVGNIDHIYPGETINLPAADTARPSSAHVRDSASANWHGVAPEVVSETNYVGE
jgi:MSHA biogenesis protein MshM